MDMSEKLTPRYPTGMGVRGSSIYRSGKASKQLDRSGPNLTHVCRFTRDKFKNIGNIPNSWTDCEQIWHTYADPSACECT